MIALAPRMVSPLQRAVTVASPTPTTPHSVVSLTRTKSETSCRPRAETIRLSGLSGIRTWIDSILEIRMF